MPVLDANVITLVAQNRALSGTPAASRGADKDQRERKRHGWPRW
jgi:hypothetical protein